MHNKKALPSTPPEYLPYFLAVIFFFMFLIWSLAYGLSFALPNGLHTFLILLLVGVLLTTVSFFTVGNRQPKVFLFVLLPYTTVSTVAVLFVYGFGSYNTKPIEPTIEERLAEFTLPPEQATWSILIDSETRSKYKIHIDLLPDYDTRQRLFVTDWAHVNIRHIAASEITDDVGTKLYFPTAMFRDNWHIITPENPRFTDFVRVKKFDGKDVFGLPGKDKQDQPVVSYEWLKRKLK